MMVENFGSYLKHERELMGVPLEEISGATKIHIRFLKALEDNSFDELPGEVFIQGYIRSYANIIGLDVEEMLNIYKESVEFKNQENTLLKVSSVKTRSKTLLTFGLLILVVVGLLFGVGILIKKRGDPEQVKAPSMQEQEEITISKPPISSDISENRIVEENVDVQKAGSAEPETSALSVNLSDQLAEELDEKKVLSPEEPIELNAQTSSASRADPSPQNPGGVEKPLKLTIRAKENSWFNMTIDDFRDEDFILPAGTAKTFRANEAFRLTVGNKTGVELLLNGKVLTLPESKGRVVKDFIISSKLVE